MKFRSSLVAAQPGVPLREPSQFVRRPTVKISSTTDSNDFGPFVKAHSLSSNDFGPFQSALNPSVIEEQKRELEKISQKRLQEKSNAEFAKSLQGFIN